MHILRSREYFKPEKKFARLLTREEEICCMYTVIARYDSFTTTQINGLEVLCHASEDSEQIEHFR
jgi:hypothetical protein